MDKENYASNDRQRRECTLVDMPHGAVTLAVEIMTKHSLREIYGLNSCSDGVSVEYRGHKDDVAAVGCLQFVYQKLDRFHKDGYGGIWWLTSKAGPGRRGYIAITYYSCNLALVSTLPGVRELYPTALAKMTSRPVLRLVVDNT